VRRRSDGSVWMVALRVDSLTVALPLRYVASWGLWELANFLEF
jgi:hypothetical protein